MLRFVRTILSTSLLLTFFACTSGREYKSGSAFEKKVECEKYGTKVLQEFRQSGVAMPGAGPTLPGNYYIERVLYSPKEDSCFCMLASPRFQNGESIYDVQLVDALTKKLLWSRTFRGEEVVGKMADNIDAEVKQYQ